MANRHHLRVTISPAVTAAIPGCVKSIGAAFPGGTYDPIYYVADVVAAGPVINGDLNLALDQCRFPRCFPDAWRGRVRLVGTIDSEEPDREFQWDDVSQDIIRRLQIETRHD